MSDAAMLGVECGGCRTTVWMVPEDDGADIEALFDGHLHLVEGEDGDETVLLCDRCAELLTSAGLEPPDWTLGALLRERASQQAAVETVAAADFEVETEMGLGL